MPRGTGLLFWAMFLSGGGGLAACLLLPAYLEYRAALTEQEAVRQRAATLEYQRTARDAQIDHLKNDPSYAERLARRELGIETPGVRTIRISPPPASAGEVDDASAATSAAATAERSENWRRSLDDAIRRYPFLSLFVLKDTRRIVMALSAGVVLAALVLLNRERPAARRTAAARAFERAPRNQ